MRAAYVTPVFSVIPSRTILNPRRRPRPCAPYRRPRALRLPPRASQRPPDDQYRSYPRQAEAQESYLRCVECSALYAVEPDELEGAPRVVSCSACLHEWYASEADLLWGEEEALKSLEMEGSFEARSRRAKEAAKKEEVRIQKKKQDLQKANGAEHNQLLDVANAKNCSADGEENTPQTDGVMGQAKKEQNREENRTLRVQDETIPASGIPYGDRLNIFVGNLSFRATEEDLYRAFSGYGVVLKCQVPSDPSGASKGYGFVEMSNREAGQRAIDAMQGASILGRDVSLHEARPKRELGSRRQGSKGLGREGKKRNSVTISEKLGGKEKGQRERDRSKSKHSRELTS